MKLRTILVICTYLLTTSFIQKDVEEELYLHVNTTTVLSGETILFSAFVNSKLTNKPSPLSKIVYIELINDAGKVAYQAKISISEGRGYGDIFIPSTFSSGTYQLLGYTRWMKNFNNYFEIPISIINPFEQIEVKSKSTSEDWSMDFFPSQSGIILNLDNNIAFKVNTPSSINTSFKGKIVNDLGESVLDFSSVKNGIGNFILNPKSTTRYQAILEDNSGEFHFFDLPPVKINGATLNIVKSESSYVLKVSSTSENFEGKIIVQRKKNTILNKNAGNNATFFLPKKDLEDGLYYAYLVGAVSDTIDSKYLSVIGKTTSRPSTIKNYAQRELVEFTENILPGSYTASVRKIRNGFKDYKPSAVDYSKMYADISQFYRLPIESFDLIDISSDYLNTSLAIVQPKQPNQSDDISYLPEFRGELLEGSILDLDSQPLIDKHVAYSILGSNQISFSQSNENGQFTLNVFSINQNTDAYISALDTEGYQVIFQDNFLKKHPDFTAPELTIDSTILAGLVNSSLNTQIENAYFEVKKDSVYKALTLRETYSHYDFLYTLDDYNRFPSIKDTFVEYIPAVSVRKKQGKTILNVRSGEYNPNFNEAPLLLLDGIPVDPESLLAFSPYKVQSIGIISKRAYFGPKIFDGVISFHTFEKNLHDYEVNSNSLKIEMTGVQPKKTYSFPIYNNGSLDRIPDKREQLYWDPNITIDDTEINFDFYTSDVTGTYEIEIEGFSFAGEPVSISQNIEID